MFSLEYRVVIQTLQRMRYTGMVQALIPTGPLAGGMVFLQVQRGKIVGIRVVGADGRSITDKQLIEERLARSGLLEWNLVEQPANPTQVQNPPAASNPTPSPSPSSIHQEEWPAPPPSAAPSRPPGPAESAGLSPYSYPRHVPVDPTWMSSWPIMHRQVYNLSTGHYSEQDIARLLRYPQSELIKVFDELQRMEVIKRTP